LFVGLYCRTDLLVFLIHVDCQTVILLIGLDENHEFTKFTEAMNFGACREFKCLA